MKTPEEQAREWEARTRKEYRETPDSQMWLEYYLPEEMSPQNAFLAGYSAATTWIPVTERMPESGQHVLLFPNTVNRVGYGCHFNGRWCDWEDHTEPFTTSYWLPLPAAPKGEGK
jgi:hypothetical protein